MAFSRKRKRGGEDGKRLGKMGGEPSSSLGGILEFGLGEAGENQIVNGSHDFASISNRHAGCLFFHPNSAPVM